MKRLDCKGFTCPKPVILTKKEFENKELSELEVIVDNEAASINVSKFAASIGVNSELVKKDGLIHVFLKRSENLSISGNVDATTNTGDSTGAGVGAGAGATKATTILTAGCESIDVNGEEELVLLVSSEMLGVGDDKLGAALMKSYLYALTESDKKPKVMMFLNGGVKLTAEGSDVMESIKALEESGTEILSCGTCLDFYGLKDKLLIGSVTNMYTIIEKMHHATNTIKL
jgi:selenium metabolism protein YedF